MSQIKVFGSLCYDSTLQNHITKLFCKARKSLFLGYVIGFKGLVLLDLHSQEIFISWNVTFHKNILPYHIRSPFSTHDREYLSDLHNKSESNSPICNVPEPSVSDPIHPTHIIDKNIPIIDNSQPFVPPLITHASSRVRHQSSHTKDYICTSVNDTPNQSSSSTLYFISNYFSYSQLSPSYYHFI